MFGASPNGTRGRTGPSTVLRNQVRGITGALVVSGLTVLLTMETWWLAWERPASHLLAYAVVGLLVVLLVTRSIGFRIETEGGDGPQYDPVRLGTDFAELVLQSVVAALVVLVVYGVVDAGTPVHVAARMVLLQVVPLGFGAALSNRLLVEAEDRDQDSAAEHTLPENVAVFAVGAVFFSVPLGANVEMNVLAGTAGWPRLGAILLLSLLTVYLILYELEFRGQSGRVVDRPWAPVLHGGQACVVYAVGLSVSALLLSGYGYFSYSLHVDVQQLVVLSFPTSVGGAAARVIL